MRVLLLTKGLDRGGAERVVVQLATGCREAGHKVVVAHHDATCTALEDELRGAGLPVVRLAGQRLSRVARGRVLSPFGLRTLVRRFRPDIVHVHAPITAVQARVWLRADGRSRPAMITTEHLPWGTSPWLLDRLHARTVRYDDQIVAVSQEVRRSIPPGVVRRPVVVHTNGIDVAEVTSRTDRGYLRRSLAIPAAASVIGMVANHREQKNHPRVIEATGQVQDRGRDVHLVLIGGGTLRARHTALAAERLRPGSCHVLGERADALELASGADVLVLPSLWEGTPLAVLEAAALGRPQVCAPVGGIPDVLGPDGAVYVDPTRPEDIARGLERVLSDPPLRARMVAAASERVREHTVQSLVADTLAMYGRLMPGQYPAAR